MRLVAMIAALGAGACDDVPDDPCAAAPAIRAEMEAGVEFWTPNHEDALVARVIPGGFGGVYLDQDYDALVLVLTDLDEGEAAVRQFQTALACGAVYRGLSDGLGPVSFVTREGRYDAIQLLEWRGIATLVAWEDPDVTGLGINSAQNKITISVADEGAVTRVVRRIVAAGVPPGALLLEVGGIGSPL